MANYFEIPISPRFDEIDSYNIVHHKNFFSWFEEGRFRLAERLGLLEKIMQDDLKIFVVECGCRYKIPVRYQDKLLLRTYISNATGPLCFRYSVIRVCDKSEVAEGFTKHVFIKDNMLLTKIPQEIREKLEVFYERK